MKKLFLLVGLIPLSFCLGCGSNTNAFGGGTGSGKYSNASLSGQYVYSLSGIDGNNGSAQYREAGVFVADGKGNITSGTDDFSEATSGATSSAVTGSYSIANDGTGTIVLTSSGGSINLAVTLVSSSQAYLIENDSALNASGVAELQDSSAIASAPSGPFVFKIHTTSASQGAAALVGVMNVSGGAITGTEDVNRAGVASSLTLASGIFNAPPSLGRGTGTFTDSVGSTLSFNYYIVNATTIRFLVSTPGINGVGIAEAQTSTAALSGSYAFGSKGDDAYGFNGIQTPGGVRTVGAFTAASGSITGTFDSVQDGNPVIDAPFTGTFTSANGRSAVTLSTGSQQVFYTVSSSRAYFVTTADPADTSNVEDGTADLQQSSTFSNASLKGQYAFMMSGFNVPNGYFVDRVGWLQWDGTSAVSLSEDVNDSAGGQPTGVLTGTYSVATNGRITATITNFSLSSNDFVGYLVSGSQGYLLQSDTGIEIGGAMTLQQ